MTTTATKKNLGLVDTATTVLTSPIRAFAGTPEKGDDGNPKQYDSVDLGRAALGGMVAGVAIEAAFQPARKAYEYIRAA